MGCQCVTREKAHLNLNGTIVSLYRARRQETLPWVHKTLPCSTWGASSATSPGLPSGVAVHCVLHMEVKKLLSRRLIQCK